MKKEFDAVVFMRTRSAAIDEEDRGLSKGT
jgi:hypothetical protein